MTVCPRCLYEFEECYCDEDDLLVIEEEVGGDWRS